MTIEETKQVLDDAVETLEQLRAKPRGQLYIGDGVYAEFDRGMIHLWTEREGGRHEIWLEQEVYATLLLFGNRCGW